MADRDLITPGQRHAAALLLMAFDFPAEAIAGGHQILQAVSVCPDLKMADLPGGAMGGPSHRRACLEMAAGLIAIELADFTLGDRS